MNRADVELLNNAITGMGQSFGQARRESAEEDYRQKMLDQQLARDKALQEHYGAEKQHYSNIEAKQDATLQHQQAQDAIKNLNDLYEKQLQQLQGGQIDENQFNQQAKAAVDSVYDANHTILQNTPFAPWANDSSYRIKKGNPAMMMTPGTVGNRQVAIGPKGSVNYTDTFSPADKAELDDASQNLKDVQSALNKITPDDQGNYTAAQAAQIHRLSLQKQQHQARRLAVLQKYQQQPGAGAAATPDATQPTAPTTSTGTPQSYGSSTNAPTMRFVRDSNGNLVPAK